MKFAKHTKTCWKSYQSKCLKCLKCLSSRVTGLCPRFCPFATRDSIQEFSDFLN
jgi:hypothetical protein